MRPAIRNLSIAVLLAAAATAANAQTNPAARGQRDSFYYGALNQSTQRSDPSGVISSPLAGNSGIARPVGRYGPVTPVPEPSQWAMMLAGLALVGFIVRRNSKRS
jgi:hypothetical protein